MEVTARYTQDAHILQVRNGTTWSIDTDEGNFRQILDATPPWYGAELSKRIEFGVLYVDLYSDIEDPTEVTTGGTYAFTFPGIQVGGQYVSQSSNIHLPAVLDGVNGRASCTGCSFVYTTGQLQMTAGNMTFTPSDGSAASTLTAETVTSTVPDADYLAGGVWLIVPDDATSAADYVFGAFGNGSDRFLQGNLAGVEGTATYDGDATGVYSEETGGSTAIGYFDGDVTLTANFGTGNDLGTISGSITNFEVDGGSGRRQAESGNSQHRIAGQWLLQRFGHRLRRRAQLHRPLGRPVLRQRRIRQQTRIGRWDIRRTLH